MPAVQTPVIYSPRFRSPSAKGSQRFAAAVVACVAIAVLGLAAWLEPSPTGVGTHVGTHFLKPCPWIAQRNMPCPSCGMTTSFSWFVRGNILASLYVQPMGCALAFCTAVAFLACTYIAVTGRAAWRIARFIPVVPIIWSLVGLWLLAWGWKVFIHLRGIDGWS